MVTTINIKCPHCDQVSQIFLSTNVCVIILNCPSCLSPIMYFRQKIFLLDPRQVKKITGSTQNATVLRLLEQITNSEESVQGSIKSISAAPALKQSKHAACTAAVKTYFEETKEKYITKDDLTNLRIELELCMDSQQFINQL